MFFDYMSSDLQNLMSCCNTVGQEWEKRKSQYFVELLTRAKMVVCYQHWFNDKLKAQHAAAVKKNHSIFSSSSTLNEEYLVK